MNNRNAEWSLIAVGIKGSGVEAVILRFFVAFIQLYSAPYFSPFVARQCAAIEFDCLIGGGFNEGGWGL